VSRHGGGRREGGIARNVRRGTQARARMWGDVTAYLLTIQCGTGMGGHQRDIERRRNETRREGKSKV
jgi:hypothetical protein